MGDIATIGYIGRKARLVGEIAAEVARVAKVPPAEAALIDAFSGSAAVTSHALRLGYHVASVDAEEYARVFAAATATPFDHETAAAFTAMADAANAARAPAELGPVATEYSDAGPAGRAFWSGANAAKIDAALRWLAGPDAPPVGPRRDFLVAGLLAAADAVANTTSVYGAYLKTMKARARAPLALRPFHTSSEIRSAVAHAFRGDAITELGAAAAAVRAGLPVNAPLVVYADPPYNSRQYSANYAPLAFIAGIATGITPVVRAETKTGLLAAAFASDFCSRRRAPAAFAALASSAAAAAASYLIVSYSDDGILSIDELRAVLGKFGPVESARWPIARYVSSQLAAASSAADAADAPLCEWLLTVRLGDGAPVADALATMSLK